MSDEGAQPRSDGHERNDGPPGPAPSDRPHPESRRTTDGIRIDPVVEAEHDRRRAVVSALVEHEPGVLARVSGLVSRRQFNIESLTVGPTTVAGHARITMVVEETDPGVDQLKKQLRKLPVVIAAGEIAGETVSRELVLVKVRGDEPERVHAITEMYDGETIAADPQTITVELTGDESRVDAAIDAYRQFGIVEIARTGQTALARGDVPTTPGEAPAPGCEAARREASDQASRDTASGERQSEGNGPTDAGGDSPRTATTERTGRTEKHGQPPAE
ncbi:acetolactate synthase, small subunit [Halovivax ruber XH-70]|uniref:Acetolactate synthase, small subunit n=1 Tax=Halovivax ruber (strain DSM 18193 / JCM 13892 / XH-70) TaxID=797302 RepID=L0IEJ0_HALRX|nr:acetolactate synthase small subunit [Halovivax ruber]AGB17189.1 acetolactate synthase, small subunit [Halovivax ruber XH-70]